MRLQRLIMVVDSSIIQLALELHMSRCATHILALKPLDISFCLNNTARSSQWPSARALKP